MTTVTTRVPAGVAGGATQRITGAITANTTKRVTGAITASITVRVATDPISSGPFLLLEGAAYDGALVLEGDVSGYLTLQGSY